MQNVNVRLDLAFKAFFRRIKAAETPGYPRFKNFGRYDSLRFSQYGNGIKLDTNNKIKPVVVLSKVGHFHSVLHRPIKGTIKTAIIKRSATGKWYSSFTVETTPERLPPNPNQVGIDVGLKTFATLSDGQELENPRLNRSEEKALAKAQRKLSKAEKGTAERKQKRKIVARVHERVAWRRENFAHQHSRKIINNNGFIAVEAININRMVHNHCLAKSISDAAWSMFFECLSYIAVEADRAFVKVNPAYTSQTGSNCGHRASERLTLSDRIFSCECCQLHIDRDRSAAHNILKLGLGLQTISNQSVDAPAFMRGE